MAQTRVMPFLSLKKYTPRLLILREIWVQALKRPLILLSLVTLIPGLFSKSHELRLAFLIFCLLALLFFPVAWPLGGRSRTVCLSALLLAFLSFFRISQLLPPDDLYEGQELVVEGKVQSILYETRKGGRFLYRMKSIDGYDIALEGDASLLKADRIRCTLLLNRPQKASNPGGFDQAAWLKGKGIYYTGKPLEPIEIVSENRLSLRSYKRELRSWIRENCARILGNGESQVYLALSLSEQSSMEDGMRAAMQWLSLSHLCSVSGMHAGFLFAFMKKLMKRGRAGYKTRLSFMLLPAFFYLWLCNRPPGLQRVIDIYLCKEAGRFFQLRLSAPSILAVAALMRGLVQPTALLDRGFLYSFSAAAAILCFSPLIEGFLLRRFPATGKKLATSIASLLSAQAAICLMCFQERRLLLPFTLFFQPSLIAYAALIFVSTPVFLLLAALLRTNMAAAPAACLLRVFRALCIGLFRASSAFHFQLYLDKYFIFSLTLFFILMSHFFRRNTEAISQQAKILLGAFICCSLLINLFLPAWVQRPPTFIFMDVGQGDGMLLLYRDQACLIDGGTEDKALQVWLPAMLALGIQKLDLVILTHAHADHTAAAMRLAEWGLADRVLLPENFGKASRQQKDSTALETQRLISELGLQIEELHARDRISFWNEKELYMDVLRAGTERADPDDENQNSVLLLLHLGKARILLTGDATAEIEEEYLQSDGESADVLKVAHHGSGRSSTEPFLHCVQPSLAFISVGFNHYGHPAERVLQALSDQNVLCFRSDLDGAMQLRTEGGYLWLSTCKSQKTCKIAIGGSEAP